MIPNYRALAQRIRQECEELDRVLATIERHWQGSRTAADPEPYLNSVALNLHGFYSGLERIFELVAVDLDGTRLGGEHWHTELPSTTTQSIWQAPNDLSGFGALGLQTVLTTSFPLHSFAPCDEPPLLGCVLFRTLPS